MYYSSFHCNDKDKKKKKKKKRRKFNASSVMNVFVSDIVECFAPSVCGPK
jgi:hypothetical protein